MKERVSLTQETFSTIRMEALTDGVFAIAMTLLILDVKVENFGVITSSAQLANVLYANATTLISFVVSFLLLGGMWAVHMRQFEYINKSDRRLTLINTWRLLIVVFMPLTTSIGSTYPDIELARVLLPLNFLLLTMVSTVEWRYAVSKKYLAGYVSQRMRHDAMRRNIDILITAFTVTVLSLFIGLSAFIVFAILPLASLPVVRSLTSRLRASSL